MPDTRTEPGMKSEIGELIERLGKATGPGRELDREIWRVAIGKASASDDDAPDYTSSIDTAMTLVPEGLHWACEPEWEDRKHRLYRPYRGEQEWSEWSGVHKFDAIALCIASLRALSHTGAKND